MLGTTVGKYRILERLGRGGMGTVYKALDETLDREVAIKVLNPDLGDSDVLKRFRAEAISLARLNHPGIATIYELHRHDDDLLMVMEYVRGQTLQTLSERLGPLDPPQAAHVCVQVLDALAHAHRAGIVHRDLKPANVMLTDSGIVKVMDFGIARMLGGEHYTHAGYMMGTPAYMAPEQVLGHEVDGRADLYSVGVLFYRLLSRQLPFQADTAIAMAQKQVAEAPTPIATFRPGLPQWCEAILENALTKNPEARFQTADAFRSAILSAVTPATLGELPTMATPTAAGLLRTSDVTMPHRSATVPVAVTSPHLPITGMPAPANTSPTAVPHVERTATTVVLGRGHLISLAALLIVLVGGITVLAIVALMRKNAEPPVTTAPVANQPSSSAAPTAGQPSAPVTEPPPPAAAAPPVPQPPAPAVPGARGAGPSSVPATATDPAARKAKPTPKPSEPAAVPAPAPPVAEAAPPPEPPAPALPKYSPITFRNVKILVTQGDDLRDRDAVLTFGADQLSVLDRAGKAEIVSLPYTAIVRAFYSRSKQPKWKDPDGKEAVASVNMGKLGFFRGDRNWLILTTQASPVFIRFESGDLNAVLSAVQQRTGKPIQR